MSYFIISAKKNRNVILLTVLGLVSGFAMMVWSFSNPEGAFNTLVAGFGGIFTAMGGVMVVYITGWILDDARNMAR